MGGIAPAPSVLFPCLARRSSHLSGGMSCGENSHPTRHLAWLGWCDACVCLWGGQRCSLVVCDGSVCVWFVAPRASLRFRSRPCLGFSSAFGSVVILTSSRASFPPRRPPDSLHGCCDTYQRLRARQQRAYSTPAPLITRPVAPVPCTARFVPTTYSYCLSGFTKRVNT